MLNPFASSGSNYPPVGFHFDVKIIPIDIASDPQSFTSSATGAFKAVKGVLGALGEAGFQEVSGISATISTEDILEGGQNRMVYKVPKQIQYPNLVLKRGLVTAHSELDDWCKETVQSSDFKVAPRMVVLTLLGANHSPLVVWYFMNAYPVKYEITGFNAEQNQLVIQTVELAYQRFERFSLASLAMQGASAIAGKIGF